MIYGKGMMLVAVAMLSLVAGMFLLMKACREEVCCRLFYKIVSYAVIVISMLLVLCGGYTAVSSHRHYGLWSDRPTGNTRRVKRMRPGMMREMREEMRETEEAE